MYTGTFSAIVSKDYDTIKNIFINRSNNRSLLWCEDTFHDVIIKCIERFEDKIISKDWKKINLNFELIIFCE